MLKNGTIDFIGSIPDTLDHYLKDNDGKQNQLIIDNIAWKKSSLSINKIEINNTDQATSTIRCGQQSIKVVIEGQTDEDMTYDIMVIFKSKDGIPLATYAKGHYEGIIKHQEKGSFIFENNILLPKILTRGLINVDLFIHHPTVEYYLKAPNCCVLDCEGYQSGFGVSMLQETNGLIGLSDI